MLPPVELLVCVTCRTTAPADAAPDAARGDRSDGLRDGLRDGARLHALLVAADCPEGVAVRGVECLSNCGRGCTVALRGGPARWTYVYGNLDPDIHLPAVLDGAARYRATPDGLVPWRARPETFRRNCIARIPPLDAPEDPHGRA